MNTIIPILKNAIVSTFNSGDWKDLAYKLEEPDQINNHSRLLRSLKWNDDDYDSCVFEVLEFTSVNYPDDIKFFFLNSKIKKWIEENNQSLYAELYDDSKYVPDYDPTTSETSAESVERALKDAKVLIETNGPASAIDRVHTALHAFLIIKCENYGISYEEDAGITKLYKLLRSNAPPFKAAEASNNDISKTIKAMAAIIDTLNPIRNRQSAAHPSDNMLGKEEAVLVINIVKSLLHYLDAKLKNV